VASADLVVQIDPFGEGLVPLTSPPAGPPLGPLPRTQLPVRHIAHHSSTSGVAPEARRELPQPAHRRPGSSAEWLRWQGKPLDLNESKIYTPPALDWFSRQSPLVCPALDWFTQRLATFARSISRAREYYGSGGRYGIHHSGRDQRLRGANRPIG
jgi:hypothetical protein